MSQADEAVIAMYWFLSAAKGDLQVRTSTCEGISAVVSLSNLLLFIRKYSRYAPLGSLNPGKAFYVKKARPNPAPNPYDGETSSRWECNLANRTGGKWFSALKEGEGKDWRLAQTVKKVNATCMGAHWEKEVHLETPAYTNNS